MHTTSVGGASVRHNSDWSGICEVSWEEPGVKYTVRMPGRDFLALARAVSAHDVLVAIEKVLGDIRG